MHAAGSIDRRRRVGRAFTMIELLVVAAVLAVFASLVIPGFAGAGTPSASVLEPVLEADLQRARTEAMARGAGISMMLSADGSRWWIATSKDASTPLEGTMRQFGRGALEPFARTKLSLGAELGEEQDDANGARPIAQFDANGARDEALRTLTFHANGSRTPLARWTLAPGRARLTRE